MQIHVIIPAYNEEDVIRDCVESLLAQTYPKYRVTIVDDQSTDRTASIVEEYVKKAPDRIELKQFGKIGPGKARNQISKTSEAEIIAFTDADCIPSPHWLNEIIQGFNTPEIASTGGPHLAPPQSSSYQIKIEKFLRVLEKLNLMDFYKSSPTEIIETKHNPLCNVAYRRQAFLELNGFREDLWPGEDIELDERLRKKGMKITFNPKAIVYHHRPDSPLAWKKVMMGYGRAQGKMVREEGPRRLIHWLGLMGFPLAMIAPLQPLFSNTFGIWLTGLQWFQGFWEGFLSNRSDPPGQKLNEK